MPTQGLWQPRGPTFEHGAKGLELGVGEPLHLRGNLPGHAESPCQLLGSVLSVGGRHAPCGQTCTPAGVGTALGTPDRVRHRQPTRQASGPPQTRTGHAQSPSLAPLYPAPGGSSSAPGDCPPASAVHTLHTHSMLARTTWPQHSACWSCVPCHPGLTQVILVQRDLLHQ